MKMASQSLLVVLILLGGQCLVHGFGSSKTIPININCGQVSSYKWLNLVKPSGGQICNYVVKPYNVYVCQLRVDFSTNLPSPIAPTQTEVPTCPTIGYIQIGRFKICGTSSDQHLYIPFSGSNLQNSFTISTNAGGGTYQMKVTQIECPPGKARSIKELTEQPQPKQEETVRTETLAESRTFDTALIAPSGCDQYFTSLSGPVESFNWNYGQGPYPANLQYTVCFKKPSTSQKMQLYAQDFDLENNGGTQINNDCYDESGNGMPGLATDYIFSPRSKIMETGISADYYCGKILRGKTLESSMFGLYWFTFNSGSYTGFTPAKRLFKFYYNIF